MMLLNSLFNKYINRKRFIKFSNQYKKCNTHNHTFPKNIFNLDNVKIGNATYGPIEVLDYGNAQAKVKIGSFCSIANGVKFLSGGGHNMNTLSTYPFYAYYTSCDEINTTKGEINIGDDCWIGLDSLILSGAKIGKGSVVSAGSVVRGAFEPYSIIMGNPAVCVKKRFSKEIIDVIENINLNNLSKNQILEIIESLYLPLDAKLALELSKIIGEKNDL